MVARRRHHRLRHCARVEAGRHFPSLLFPLPIPLVVDQLVVEQLPAATDACLDAADIECLGIVPKLVCRSKGGQLEQELVNRSKAREVPADAKRHDRSGVADRGAVLVAQPVEIRHLALPVVQHPPHIEQPRPVPPTVS
eukprot:6741439-Prymnesium_polylepis.1